MEGQTGTLATEQTAQAADVGGDSLTDVAQQYVAAWKAVDELESQAAKLRERVKYLEPLVVEEMATNRVESISIDGRTLYRKETTRFSICKDRRDEAIRVAQESGFDDLITFNWQSVNSRIREYAEANDGALPEALKPFIESAKITQLGNTKSSR